MKKAKKRTGYLLSFNTLHLAMSWNAQDTQTCCLILLHLTQDATADSSAIRKKSASKSRVALPLN